MWVSLSPAIHAYRVVQVIGEVGSHLNYDEQIVYKNEAARPAYLVIYKP